MFGEDDFLAAPSLTEAMMGNKIKTLLLLGGVYAAGAIIGRQKSGQALSFAGAKLGDAASGAAGFVSNKLAERGGSSYYDRTAYIASVLASKPQQVDLQMYLMQNGIQYAEYAQYMHDTQGFSGNPLGM